MNKLDTLKRNHTKESFIVERLQAIKRAANELRGHQLWVVESAVRLDRTIGRAHDVGATEHEIAEATKG